MLMPALLIAGLAAITGTAAAADGPGQVQLAAMTGDCNADPGVAMVAAATQGQFVLPPNDLTPGRGWVLFMHPALPTLAFYYPPGWQPAPFAQIGVIGVRVVSPDGDAAFENFNTTNIRGVGAVTAQQVAEEGLHRVIGTSTPASLVCGFDYPVPGPMPTTAFLEAVATQSSIAVAVGQVLHDPASGTPISIDYRAIIGPRGQFAGLVRAVFLPVFTQLLQSSAGAGEEGDIGGGGDDDGDNGGDDGG
jgi:hypothetical protein